MTDPQLYHASHYDRSLPIPSYWQATGGAEPAGLEPLAADRRAEVAIIGGGYTGLSAAYHLAWAHGIEAVVLEAGPIGWGASGRNGGFCGLGGTRLDYAGMSARHGRDGTRAYFTAQKAGVDLVRDLALAEGIDIERTGAGEHYLAHKPNRMAALEARAGLVRQLFGERWEVWSRAELEERLLRSPEAHGCLVVPHYFGLHPLRWVRGLAEAAARRGAAVHQHSQVVRWERTPSGHELVTNAGARVRARRVLVATNGYPPERLDPLLAGRILPALSSILVTRPLERAELEAQGWRAPALIADSRKLLFYMRLLRDRRLLFGSRGGTDASPAAFARRRGWMRRRLAEKFPAWSGVGIDYAWWGCVALARDLLPHLGWLDERAAVLAAMAYHGGGVAFSTMLGRAAASVLAGREPDPPLPPFVRTPPPRFPLPAARIWALRAAYVGYRLVDEWR